MAAWAGAKIAERWALYIFQLYLILHNSAALATLLFRQDLDTLFSHLYCTGQAYL